MNDINRFILERKNKYAECVLHGIGLLGSVVIITTLALPQEFNNNELLDIYSKESTIIAIPTTIITLIDTLPYTCKIHKLRRKKRLEK